MLPGVMTVLPRSLRGRGVNMGVRVHVCESVYVSMSVQARVSMSNCECEHEQVCVSRRVSECELEWGCV